MKIDTEQSTMLGSSKLICGVFIVSFLFGCTRDPNKPVFEAAVHGNINTISNYLNNGGDPDLRDRKGNPLLAYAVGPLSTNSYSISKLLIDAGADVNAIDSVNLTPLNNAVVGALFSDRVDTVELLLSNGADASYNTNQALFNALQSHRDLSLRIMRLLVSSNIDLNEIRQGHKPMTLLDKAESMDLKRVAEFLRSKGAKRYEELEESERNTDSDGQDK